MGPRYKGPIVRSCDNCGTRQSWRWVGLLRMALCDWCYDRLQARLDRDPQSLRRMLRRLADGKTVTL